MDEERKGKESTKKGTKNRNEKKKEEEKKNSVTRKRGSQSVGCENTLFLLVLFFYTNKHSSVNRLSARVRTGRCCVVELRCSPTAATNESKRAAEYDTYTHTQAPSTILPIDGAQAVPTLHSSGQDRDLLNNSVPLLAALQQSATRD